MTMFSSAPSQLQRIRELTNHICDEECGIVKFFEICPDILCIADCDGVILQANHAWEENLGWSEHDLINKSIFDLIHPNDVDEMDRILRSARESHIIRFYAKLKTNRGGKYLPIEWVATLSSDGNIYMSAREIPELCLDCRRARFMRTG